VSNQEQLVSVYIPSHYRPSDLNRSLNSVLTQTHTNIEVIVALDGKCEDSISLLQDIANKDYRLKFLVNEQPKGACNARNRAIDMASGDFITGLDDDDIMEPDCIQSYLAAWNDRYALLCADYSIFGVHSNRFDLNKTEYTHFDLIEKNYVGNQVFTKLDTLKNNTFDEKMVAWQDYDCWFRVVLAQNKPFLKLGKKLYKVNVDPSRERITTGTKTATGAIQFLSKHAEYLKDKVTFWLLNDLVNRGQKIPLWLVVALLSSSQSKRAVYFFLKHSFLGSLVFSLKNFFAKFN
tara:strand:- start:8951 stop:9826 length:876 start_codon:yes stop_codon:yes gene_type:complete